MKIRLPALARAVFILACVACARGDRSLVAEFPATATDDSATLLGVIVTGDDGVTPRLRAMAERLATAGIPSVAVEPPARGASPATAGQSAEAVVREHLSRWSRRDLLLIGEDRGAGIAAFVANRIADDLRSRTHALVLVGLAPRVSFAPSWSERLLHSPRPTDFPVLPELERLRGVPILCLYDPRRRDDALCPSLDAALATHQTTFPRQHRSHVDGSARDDGDSSAGESARGAALAQRILGFVR